MKINQELILVAKKYINISYFLEKKNFQYNQVYFFTVQQFFESVTGLKKISKNETLLYFLSILKKEDLYDKKIKNIFNWISIVFNNFQYMDYNLIDPKFFFNSAISEEKMKKWKLNISNDRKFIFWEKIQQYYYLFKSFLLKKNIAYPGLIFRIFMDKFYSFLGDSKKIIFFLEKNFFLKKWEFFFVKKIFYHKNGFIFDFHKKTRINYDWNKKNEEKLKKIRKLKIYSVTKELEQIKIVKDLIKKFYRKKNINKISLILGNHHLLISIINSFVNQLNVNISFNINYPINILPIHYTFILIFQLLINKKNIFYQKKDIINFFSNGYIQKFFVKKNYLLKKISNNEYYSNYVSENLIKKFLLKNDILIILNIEKNNTNNIIKSLISFIRKFKFILLNSSFNNFLELNFLSKIENFLQKIKLIIRKNPYLFPIGIKNVYNLYNFFIKKEHIKYIHQKFYKKSKKLLLINGFNNSFFEKVDISIITSFNHGIIPPKNNFYSNHKFNNPSILNQLTFKYHDNKYFFSKFIKIYDNSKNTYLIYKNFPDEINSGEKSQFIHYILAKNPKIKIKKNFLSFFPVENIKVPFIIKKTKSINQKLNKIKINGISPSSLNLYNYNPIFFYYKKILNLNYNHLESTLEKANLGKFVHQILQNLYTNNLGYFLNIHRINLMKITINNIVNNFFKKKNKKFFFNEKNQILYIYLINHYIKNFISLDEKLIQNGEKIYLKKIEYKISTQLKYKKSIIKLHGIIDRIDEYNGINRIIDYKIGISKFKKINVSLNNIQNIFKNPKYHNILQLLFYIYLWFKSDVKNQKNPVIAEIISPKIKNDSCLSKTSISFFKNKDPYITYNDYKKNFLPFLSKRIFDIFDPKKNIVEKFYP